jgi:hypothetical protein
MVGQANVQITDGGTLEANKISSGFGGMGTLSNRGGIYQFTTNAPTLTANTANSIVLTNGTIAFRGIANADVYANQVGSQLTNITFQGNNIFRLNNASNNFASASQNYTFATNSGSTNYGGLEMVNGSTAWRSAWLTIGSGGTLLASNTSAIVDGVLTNSGAINVVNANVSYLSNVVLNGGSSYLSQSGTNTFNNIAIASQASFLADALSQVTINGSYQNLGSSVFSNLLTVGSGGSYVGNGTTNLFAGLNIQSGGAFLLNNGSSKVGGTVSNTGVITVSNSVVTWQAPVVISGGYISDPSTNIFTSNVTVTASGYLQGGSNDQFVFYGDLSNQSTNRTDFNLSLATVLFTNATSHTFALTNSGAVDKGSNWLNVAQLYTNFTIGTLSIASYNNLTVTGTRTGSLTNALYVGWLDLQAIEAAGITTNNYSALTNGIVAALTLPNINLYYDKNLSENAYLGGLEYDLWNGQGLLIPIPEPSPIVIVMAGIALLAIFRRRAGG